MVSRHWTHSSRSLLHEIEPVQDDQDGRRVQVGLLPQSGRGCPGDARPTLALGWVTDAGDDGVHRFHLLVAGDDLDGVPTSGR
ncbi:MAG: hypothetical protein H0X59_05160 [Chloroflexi bacterium]|nr:hypothetical protein [Chloroflexota bacterium]